MGLFFRLGRTAKNAKHAKIAGGDGGSSLVASTSALFRSAFSHFPAEIRLDRRDLAHENVASHVTKPDRASKISGKQQHYALKKSAKVEGAFWGMGDGLINFPGACVSASGKQVAVRSGLEDRSESPLSPALSP